MGIQYHADDDSRQIIDAMASRYSSVYWADLNTLAFEAVKDRPAFSPIINQCKDTREAFSYCANKTVAEDFKKGIKAFCDLKTLSKRLKENPHLEFEYKSKQIDRNWCKIHIIALKYDGDEPKSILVAFEDIELDKAKDSRIEKQLYFIKGLVSCYETILIFNAQKDQCEYTTYGDDSPEGIRVSSDEDKSFVEQYKLTAQLYCHPDFREMMMKYADLDYIKRVLKGKKRHTVRFKGMDKQGTYIWVEMSLIKFDEIKADPTYVAITYSNVDADETERRAQQAALEDVRTIIKASEMGTWHIKLIQGKKATMDGDDKMHELLGIEGSKEMSEEELYEAWHSRVSEGALESVSASVGKMISSGVRDENTYLWIHPTKGETYVRCGGTATPILGGHLLSGYHYDVTNEVIADMKQKRELEDAIQANKVKTTFLHNMIHDIRNPLNSIFGFSQLLAMPDGTWSNAEKEEHLKQIENSHKLLNMLIDDVLAVAKTEHGNYIIKKTVFKINTLCRQVVLAFEFKKPEGVNMYFTSDVDDDYQIESDERRIAQVLSNFMSNAIKHTKAGEIHVHCSTTEHPGKLTLSVADTGEGVPPEMAQKIFERFQKHNMEVEGTGIGLNICSMIAERLDAEVMLDTSYTNGARFVFVI